MFSLIICVVQYLGIAAVLLLAYIFYKHFTTVWHVKSYYGSQDVYL